MMILGRDFCHALFYLKRGHNMNTLSYSDTKPITPNFAKLIEKAAVLSPVIQEEIILQWFDDIENDTATLQWQKTVTTFV
jgi:hypothetical protein